MKISTKVSLTILVGASVAILGLTLVTNHLVISAVGDASGRELLNRSDRTMKTIDEYFSERISDMKFFASRLQVRKILQSPELITPQDKKDFIVSLQEIMTIKKAWTEISVIGKDGTFIATTDEHAPATIFQEQNKIYNELFPLALSGNVAYSDAYLDPEKKETTMVFFVPAFEGPENKTIIGVIEGHIQYRDIKEILNTFTLGYVHIISKDGTLIASNDRASQSQIVSAGKFSYAPIHQKLGGKTGYVIANGIHEKGQSVFVLRKEGGYRDYRGNGWTLLYEEPGATAFSQVSDILVSQLAFFIPIVFLSALFALAVIQWSIVRPIKLLSDTANIIAAGNLKVRSRIASSDEIGVVSSSFNHMADVLTQLTSHLEEKVKEQTAQISHSLQEVQDKNILLEDGRKAMLNVLEDIEVEKKKAEQLATDLEKFQLAVENASDHIVITDAEGFILYANKAVETITGYSPLDILGKKAGGKELWGGRMGKAFYEVLWNTIKSEKKVFAGEINNHRKNGNPYTAHASISPILNKDGKVEFFIGIERDVTREKEIDRMKTEFISLSSHQLRTPLSAMKWFGEMLLAGDAGTLSADQKEMVENIYASNERMIELVNALLNISRIESGRLVIDPKPTDISELVRSVVEELKIKFHEKHQTCSVSIQESLPLVSLDPKLIRQVYINLLTNANKYTDTGGEIQIHLSKTNTDLLSQITDNGYGIPKEEQGRVFEKFYRGHNIVKLETEGTGLGLYLIKSIIESSGGKIWFESEPGKGTTFWFSIPLSGMVAKKGEVGIEEATETKKHR